MQRSCSKKSRFRGGQAGFTLLELILTLLIVGIVTGTAVSGMNLSGLIKSGDEEAVSQEAYRVRTYLAHLQMTALFRGTDKPAIELTQGAAAGQVVFTDIRPAGLSATSELSDGVNFSFESGETVTVTVNERGIIGKLPSVTLKKGDASEALANVLGAKR